MSKVCDRTETEIYAGLKSRQGWAVECLYLNYFYSATLPIYQHGGGMDDRRDIFQDAVLLFLKNIHTDSFEYQENKLGAYLRKIVHLKWRNAKRKNKLVQLEDTVADQLSFDGDKDILQIFEREEQRKQYVRLLLLLSDKCKDILMKRYREQATEKDLAKKWDFGSTKALQVARSRCIKNLKSKLQVTNT